MKISLEGLQSRWKKFCNFVSALRNEEYHHIAHVITKNLNYLLHHLRIRNIRGYARYGSEDPANVGNVFVFLSLLYPKTKNHFQFVPVFDHNVLDCDVRFKGHFRLIHLVIIFIKLFLDRPTRTWILQHLKEGSHGRSQ